MIAAVIVTYNRKNLLYRNINSLLSQTASIDHILIIDNCSSDGTYELLLNSGIINLNNIKYIKTEENIGGAGGFYIGMKEAYECGADWIVLMDDDGYMADEYTMEVLYREGKRLYENGYGDKKLFINALVQQGDMLSFKMGSKYTVKDAAESARNGIIEGEANPFNGTMVSKELITAIGYPNPDFFIKGDEVDYKQRTRDAGGYIATVIDARYIHPRPDTREKVVMGINVPFFVEAPWKEYYAARNFTYMYKKKGWYKAIAFELIFVKLLAILSIKCKRISTIKMLFKGVKDGWRGKLGATIKP